jgi:hypothetical protein
MRCSFFDFHCPPMSLPLAFGTSLETMLAASTYLRVDEEKVTVWRTRLSVKNEQTKSKQIKAQTNKDRT